MPRRGNGDEDVETGTQLIIDVETGTQLVLQPIMPLDLPVKVRSWELTATLSRNENELFRELARFTYFLFRTFEGE